MSRARATSVIATAACAVVLGAPAAEAVAAKAPSGYRTATASERAAMKRARGLELTRPSGYYVGLRTAKIGIVCGQRSGRRAGAFVELQRGRWVALRSSSDDRRTLARLCARA